MPSYRKSAQVDMTHGSVLGRAALFALPICAGNILQLLYSTVDTLVIGNFCDTTALASVATSSQPLEILLCVFVGIGSGISILVSQAVGRADHDQLQKLVRTSVWLLFAASLPLTVIGFLLGPWMLRLMQVPADAMPGAVLYLRITMLGILGNMGYNFNAGLLRGIGNSSSSLLLLFISCAANIILDLVLTGALGLGIGGVAAATAIALFLSWICSIFYIRRRCTELALPVLPCGFDAGALRQIVRIGLPIALQDGLIQVAFIIITIIANRRGLDTAAAVGIVEKIISFLFLVPSSMLSTVSALGAQNIGAGKRERAQRILYYAVIITVGFGVMISIIIQFIAEPVVGLFTENAKVIVLGSQYIRGYIFDCIFAGIHFSFSGYFCACGRSGYSFIIAFSAEPDSFFLICISWGFVSYPSRYFPAFFRWA